MVTAEERLSRVEGAYEQVHERLGDMNSRLDTTNETIEGLRRDTLSEIGGLRIEVNGRLDSMDKRLNTIMIAALTAAGGIIAGLIAGLIGLVVFVLNVM